MKLIIGLGNPGEEHKNNRHNAGFMMVDKLKEKWNFPDFEFNKKFNADVSKGTVNGQEILLAKPQTFMNNSGQAAHAILDFYKLTLQDVIIVHDDLDVSLGKYKIATDSSSAGHHGVQDIIDKLSTQKLKRVRIGIGSVKDDGAIVCRMDASDFVLKDFGEAELEEIGSLTEKIMEEIPGLI